MIAGIGLFSSAAAAHALPPPAALKLPVAATFKSEHPPSTADWVRRLWGYDGGGGSDGGEERRISCISVPRQKYISSSKSQVMDGVLSLFDSTEQVEEFSKLSMCLDSILHAEHKRTLEELRSDYFLLNDPEPLSDYDNYEEEITRIRNSLSQDEECDFENKKQNGFDVNNHYFRMPFQNGFNLRSLFISQFRSSGPYSTQKSRVAVAIRFQQNFMKLLHDAQFEELSVEDLMLTSALNTNYMLTLPIFVDWEKAYQSNAIIFRRGYSTERQRGLLIVEKLDYLQSKLLQRVFLGLSRPLKKIASWINQAVKGSSKVDEVQKSFEKIKQWLKQRSFPPSLGSNDSSRLRDLSQADSELPIWLAAQKAIPVYEGFLSSQGPREMLWRKLLTSVGFTLPVPDAPLDFGNEIKLQDPELRPNQLPRISISDLWEPASNEFCGNNPWKKFRNAFSILFSQSTLEEPAFQELILLYSEKMNQQTTEHFDGGSSLQLKIYEKIPIPDISVVFPHKKLSFRILDIVRLDISSILGLSAFIVNYKFEDILSSPSALLLDVIAISALILYVTRVVLGYKQTWDRYQLLVNKTLYEKTLASGFGSVHFLLDASEQQEYKEAILAYGLLLQLGEDKVVSRENIKVACERFLYEKLGEKVEMPIDKAMDTLLRLGLVKQTIHEGNSMLQAFPCLKACEALMSHWDNLFEQLAG